MTKKKTKKIVAKTIENQETAATTVETPTTTAETTETPSAEAATVETTPVDAAPATEAPASTELEAAMAPVESVEKLTFLETPFQLEVKDCLSTEEVITQAERMARLQTEIAELEAEAKTRAQRYKADIESLFQSQNRCAQIISERVQTRTVSCMRRLDWVTGMTTETRLDTDEVITTRPMSFDESQMQLSLSAQDKPQASASTDKPVEETSETMPPNGLDITQPTPPIELEPITDEMIEVATKHILDLDRASTAALTRRMKIKPALAARIMDVLEQRGVVGPAKGDEPREILNRPEAKPENGE
ncbi:hypothetical protein CCP3SC15_1110009 [Gammaproteobacteria bacterium]